MSGKRGSIRMATAFAPASVGNISVGFDMLGHAIQGPGDRVRAERVNRPGVRIRRISGCVPDLPKTPRDNAAGRAVVALIEDLDLDQGFDLWIEKGIPLGSGLGGSAASAVAALVAVNELLDDPLSRHTLYAYALEGEAAASGSRHGDNIAPMLLGGISLATGDRMLSLETPAWLWAAVVHPDQILETRHSRSVLDGSFSLSDVVSHSSHLALFLQGLYQGDGALIRTGLRDVLVEPRRAPLIPGFHAVRDAALEAGALGAGISGGGPSLFAWFDGRSRARHGGAAMQRAFAGQGIESDLFVSPVSAPGARVL